MQKLDLNPQSPGLTSVNPNQFTNSTQNKPMTPVVSHDNQANTNQNTRSGFPMIMVVVVLGLALVAGSATGFGSFKLFGQKSGGSSSAPLAQVATGSLKAGDVFGSQDTKTFRDSAQGYMVVGGVEGEGSHHLVRDSSDPVYLTSSVTDLDKFNGMIIKVWGETYKAQKAGWLMDVGRVEVVDPQAQVPAGLTTDTPAEGGN